MIIYGTEQPTYQSWRNAQSNPNNGAYWYAREIEELILPALKDMPIVISTVGTSLNDRKIPDGSVIVCHDNRSTLDSYGRLLGRNMIWICSKQSTKHILESKREKAFYIPLSIDTEYVKSFTKAKKTKKMAFVGNAWNFKKEYLAALPSDIDQISGVERVDLLKAMSGYKTVIAEGRCLMEAKVLGCETELPQYKALEAVDVDVLDCRDAIPLWLEVLEQAPAKFRVELLEDIYPFCIGDIVALGSDELDRLDEKAERRHISQPYRLV